MSRVPRYEWYRRVNAAWPKEIPALTGQEAVRAFRRLYRFVHRRTFSGKIELTSGNRLTWTRHGVWYLNPKQGWPQFVHFLSHRFDHSLRPDSGHDADHARLELRMIKQVIRRGWLAGRLNQNTAPREPRDLKSLRRDRVLAGIKRWETKLKRAQTALRTLRRRARYYERQTAKEEVA